MNKSHSMLAVFVLLGFCVSLVAPAQDAPETPYDESEALAYEITPLFSGIAPRGSGQILNADLSRGSPLRFTVVTKNHWCSRKNPQPYPIFPPLSITQHSLRC